MGDVDDLQNKEEAIAQMEQEREERAREELDLKLHAEPVRATAQLSRSLESIPLSKISTMTNMRGSDDNPDIKSLAFSIQENGLLSPPTVRRVDDERYPYQLVYGRRRFEALKMIHRKDLDQEVQFDVVENLSTVEAMNMMAVENLQRVEPEPIQFAKMMRLVLAEDPDRTAADVARSWGLAVNKAQSFLRLLELPESIQERLARGDMAFANADLLRKAIKTGKIDEEKAEELADALVDGDLTSGDLKTEAGYVPPAPEGYQDWVDRENGLVVGPDFEEYDEFEYDEEPEVGGFEYEETISTAPVVSPEVKAARAKRAKEAQFQDSASGLEALDDAASDEQLDAFLLGKLVLEYAPDEYLEGYSVAREDVWAWAYSLEDDERLRRIRDMSLFMLFGENERPEDIF